LAENREIRGISEKAHTQFEDAAMMIPMLAHLPQDRIRHRWDLMMVVMCEIDLWQTKHLKLILDLKKRVSKRNSHHLNHFRIDGFSKNVIIVVVDIFDHLLKGTSFHFLPF
jgi:hypothetical protein